MKQIVYKPVFIKTEADIPEKDIWYYGHALDIDEIVKLRDKRQSDWDYIDWYFKPVELPSEREIIPSLPITENDAYFFRDGVKATLKEIKRRNK